MAALPGQAGCTQDPEAPAGPRGRGQGSPPWLLGVLVFAVGLQRRVHLLPQRLHLGRVREPLGVCEEEGAAGENPSSRKPPGDLGTRAGSLQPPAQEAGASENSPLHAAAQAPQSPGQRAHPSVTPPGWSVKVLVQSGTTLGMAAPRRPSQGPGHAPRTRVAHGARCVQRPPRGSLTKATRRWHGHSPS